MKYDFVMVRIGVYFNFRPHSYLSFIVVFIIYLYRF